MPEKSQETVAAHAYFANQMALHLVRGVVCLGISPAAIKSNIRQTLAQGYEQFGPEHRRHLDAIAKVYEEAVDLGVTQRPK